MRRLRRFTSGLIKPLIMLVRRFAAAVRAVVCGTFQKAQQKQSAAVLRRLRWCAPHTPYALCGAMLALAAGARVSFDLFGLPAFFDGRYLYRAGDRLCSASGIGSLFVGCGNPWPRLFGRCHRQTQQRRPTSCSNLRLPTCVSAPAGEQLGGAGATSTGTNQKKLW
jgi:hypothetical protein